MQRIDSRWSRVRPGGRQRECSVLPKECAVLGWIDCQTFSGDRPEAIGSDDIVDGLGVCTYDVHRPRNCSERALPRFPRERLFAIVKALTVPPGDLTVIIQRRRRAAIGNSKAAINRRQHRDAVVALS